mgnify:CR=1 FL=1
MRDEKVMLITHELKPGDLGQIVMQHGLLYAHEYDYDFTFEAYVAEPLAQFARRNNPREKIWLVKKGGQVVASICICEVSEDTAQLRWFFVSSEARGLGLGKQLVESALNFCNSTGYKEVILWTVKGLEAAKSLYLKHGFTLQQEVEHEVWGAMQVEQRYEKTF